jgi:hypothetical protein
MDPVVAREPETYGSHGMPARAYPPMLALVADRTLRPDLLLGQVIGLAAGAALAAIGPAANIRRDNSRQTASLTRER